ncbi:unnamed protein product [Hyaloperonospora brassicae]|uniref:poly(ADP-ribose) glycohydrolase n=1 Tax=Hyaloperonospora brassicae TaxID=162125 RepID=A0AAV0T016_HYABA|nr:unnamed protein product [Hyaloperonospora brassicae]
MSHAFSLTTAVFAFHCLPPIERQELTTLLHTHNGVLYDVTRSCTSDTVFVITSYWADCAFPAIAASDHNVSFELVTRFWLLETLRLQRWLRRDSHPFFQPPLQPSKLWLQYPMEYCYDAGQDEQEARGQSEAQQEPQRPDRVRSRTTTATTTTTAHRVRLPCSPNYLFRDEVPLWPYFAAYLAPPIRNMDDLAARLQVLTLSDPRRRFNCLEYAVHKLLTIEEHMTFFREVLPQMARLVLALPQMFPTPSPLLTPHEVDGSADAGTSDSEALTMAASLERTRRAQVMTTSHRFTKLQVLTLVCGCFFGIFPDQDIRRSAPSRKVNRRGNDIGTNVIRFPCFTAVRMFSAPENMGKLVRLKAQKIRCLLQYFLRVVPLSIAKRDVLEKEVIDYTRVSVQLPLAHERKSADQLARDFIKLVQHATQQDANAQPRLYAARCVSNTSIEEMEHHVQIDFANKFAGGGVLTSGCVQEEIRFLLSPELLVSCLVFAKLEAHEAFVVHGSERYSVHQGYGASFVYHGNFEDTTGLQAMADGCLRRECVIAGMDATDYGSAQTERQYTRGHIWRDLVKAYAGFAYREASDDEHKWPVASGNWGCGVFKGDRELKFLIQWLAASLHRRELVYVLFDVDSHLQTLVDPLLELATSSEARAYDQQSGKVLQWLMAFLFDEANFDRKARSAESVLTHALHSLERALALFRARESHEEDRLFGNEQLARPAIASSSTTEKVSMAASSRGRDQAQGTTKKKSKTMQTMSYQTCNPMRNDMTMTITWQM